jgi:hypothetical protein
MRRLGVEAGDAAEFDDSAGHHSWKNDVSENRARVMLRNSMISQGSDGAEFR